MKNTLTKTCLLALIAMGCGHAYAQNIPQHPKYVTYIADGKSFLEYFPEWEPGKVLSDDENFFISRVRLKERFVNRASQVVPDDENNNARRFSLCTPMGVSDTYWQTLPRGVMDGDTFSMWSYIDFQDGWSQSWIRNVGSYSDVCHKNGVQNSGGVIFIDETGNGGDNSGAKNVIKKIVEKNADGSFKYLDKFIRYCRYYGVDGVTFNPEGTVPNASDLQDFLSQCHDKAKELGWQFHVCWYAMSSNTGAYSSGSSLTSNKSNWFVKNGKEVCDVYFLNYEWSSSTRNSINLAEQLKPGSTPNLYAGYDIQGNWMGRGKWSTLKDTKMSICFWGNHNTDMIYQNSTELGSSDESVQRCYQLKLEEVFSGGNHNPAKTPDIKDGITQSSSAAMRSFHGVAALMPARSALQELPFITRFSLGNGKVFRAEGQETFSHKWYNLAAQDYLPTWRWWITDNNGQVPDDAIACGFNYDDSWYAGNSLRFSGATKASNVRLFKTNFDVAGSEDVNLVYKLRGDGKSHARLCWALEGSETTLHYADIPAAKTGEWTTMSKTASALGMTGKVAVLGIAFDNTPADYEMLLGEMGIVPQTAYNPVKPKLTKSQLLERTYNGVSYKLIWDCGQSEASKKDASIPTYNDDVDTWYYEVFSQADGEDEKLNAITTSWAHYVVGAFATPDITRYRFGVRAVAPDGVTKSETAWSDWMTADVTNVEGISLDKSVIKAGEQFTVSYTDPLHGNAKKWQVVDPETGADVVTAVTNATSISGSIDKVGIYDVVLTAADGTATKYRNFVQISPDATGALPIITDFTAERTALDVEHPSTAVNYSIARLGEGKVSRGLLMQDANQFRIPKEALPASQKQYSVGFWVKPDEFAHSRFGTNLINKRLTSLAWPHNNWGAFWVIIWPQQKDSKGNVTLDENVLSYTLYQTDSYNKAIGGTTNSNIHETPFYNCTTDSHLTCSETYALTPGTWAHVMIAYDGTKQKIYFNGKKVCEATTPFTQYSESPIFIGGGNVYHAGLKGTIDDVQVWHKALTEAEVKEAMMGYEGKTIPAELKAYYTFESHDNDFNFPNAGTGGKDLLGTYVFLEGAAGEKTQGAYEVTVEPNIDILGNPVLSGSLEVTTTAELSAPSLVCTSSNIGGIITAGQGTQPGAHDVTLTLSNMWGKTSLTKPAYITTDDALDINGIEAAPTAAPAIFNVQGQRVTHPDKGVYIIGGKRVVK